MGKKGIKFVPCNNRSNLASSPYKNEVSEDRTPSINPTLFSHFVMPKTGQGEFGQLNESMSHSTLYWGFWTSLTNIGFDYDTRTAGDI